MIVPGRPGQMPTIGPQPKEDDLLMAAAVMHEMGRLVPKPIPKRDLLKLQEKNIQDINNSGGAGAAEDKTEELVRTRKEQGT